MKYLLILICLTSFSCQNNITVQFTCEEIRRGSLSNTFKRLDTINQIEEGRISYNSIINLDPQIKRKWIFPDLNSQDSITIYKENDREYTTKLLASKIVKIRNREFTINKYLIDDKGSEDEESNKFYCPGFGVIIETFWRRSYIKAIEFNGEINENLNRITEEVINDERFMWCSN